MCVAQSECHQHDGREVCSDFNRSLINSKTIRFRSKPVHTVQLKFSHMLTIHINKNASGLVTYFTNSLSKDDYFFSGKSIPGRWHGQLAHELELGEKVSQKDFSSLAHNKHPKTGEKLTARNVSERRTSIEYTFSAPKSVSLMMALSKKEKGREILNAHRRAVKKAMVHIEADMQTQTRINGRKTYANTGKIVYARFDHFTSRPTKEEDSPDAKYSSDPNLHSHAVVFNCTKYNGKFQAIEGSTIHRVAPYYEAIYHSHLSKSLKDLGYEIVRTKDRYEIHSPGLTRRTIEKFSRRTVEIEKLAKNLGITNPKTKGKLGATTRLSKSKIGENINLKKIWFKKLTPIEKLAIQNAKKQHSKIVNPISSKKAIDRALSHHLERNSTVPVKKLLAHSLSLGYGNLTLKELKKELVSRDNILYAKMGHLDYLTTKQMVRAEDRMIAFAASTKGTLKPINAEYKIQRGFLNNQQRKAIQQILHSSDRVSILSGAAGVGKSTLLVEIKEAASQKGKKIVALAPSSGASRGVLRSKGFKDADTIATFLKNKELQQKAKDQIILVDEASLVGVSTLNKIFDTARKSKARIILSGDTRQHGSIEHGSALRLLQKQSNLKIASVNKILRQRANPEYKKAIDLLAAGKTRLGFEKLNKMNAVIEIEEVEKRHQKIALNYIQSIKDRRSALVICPTHAEGEMITKAIRNEMKEYGRIGNREHSYTIQKNLSLTEAQKQDEAMYEKNMVVQFHQNYKGGFKAGVKYNVLQIDKKGNILIKSDEGKNPQKLPKEAHEHFQVFQKDKINLSKGDLIRITNNGRTVEKSRLHNGQTFIVNGFTPDGHICLSNGRTLDKNYANFTYGYVQTSHAAQGKDCQDVLVAQSSISFAATNEKTFYVSASRATEQVKIFTDDKEALREVISKSGEQMSARDIANKQSRQKERRLRYYNHLIKTLMKDGRAKQQSKIKVQGPVYEKK